MSGELRNAPRTSGTVTGASVTLGVGSVGELRAPRLLRFFGHDADNLNASYDVADQVVLQFDMAVSAANCTRWAVSVDNYRYCARRPLAAGSKRSPRLAAAPQSAQPEGPGRARAPHRSATEAAPASQSAHWPARPTISIPSSHLSGPRAG